MSWIQENKVPAAILGASGVGVIGLGAVLFMAYSSYSDSLAAFDAANGGIASLKSAPLAPTPANLAAKKALVDEYQSVEKRLNLVLTKLQVAEQPTTDTDFQAKLKAKIADVKKKAAEMQVVLPAEFNLAFDKYTTALPKSNQVATELAGYLNAVDEIVRMLMDSGVKRIDILERSDLPSEGDAPKEAPKPAPRAPAPQRRPGAPGAPGRPVAAPVVEKVTESHQVRAVLTTDQAALQLIMSKLANPSDMPEMPYFPIVRLLRIENERLEGPLRSEAVVRTEIGPDGLPVGSNPTPAVAPGPEGAPVPQANTVRVASPATPDSVAVLGNEKLRAFLEIDLVKFLQPQAPATTPQGTR